MQLLNYRKKKLKTCSEMRFGFFSCPFFLTKEPRKMTRNSKMRL